MNGIDKARLQTEARIYRDAIGEKPDSKWELLKAIVSERGFATRVIRKRLHLPARLNTTDRADLEQKILPYYGSDQSICDVLFVGCGSYTADYQSEFFPDINFVTLDPDPENARYGSSCHIEARLENLDEHCPAGSFDLIICNGVVGWGLDTYEQCEAAFSQCHRCLVRNGEFILGWDDVPQRTRVTLDRLPSLARFRKRVFPAFETWRYRTDTPFRHTFDFYQK